MSNPKEQQREQDELELESETVRDLDLPSSDADDIRAGRCIAGGTNDTICLPSNYTN